MKILLITVRITLTFFIGNVNAQNPDSGSTELKVLARTSADSIVLRWAPMQTSAWLQGNKFGYTIERYVLVRNNRVLTRPEKKVLTTNPIRPLALDSWEPLVKQNKYAAIAAQSLYGSSFQLTTQGTDVFQILNKVKENEQRFSFALFSADMSAPVSIAMGLRFTDKDVKKGEKYLYRINCIPFESGYDTLKGSIFTELEKYELPKPIDFSGEFKGNLVSLTWDQSHHSGIYSAYSVERSADGKNFKPISEEPLVTLSPGKTETRYQYASDSLPDLTNEYQYRVRGFTPFGELGPPTDVVKGKGSIQVEGVPHIEDGRSENNRTINIRWDFPTEFNKGIKGFNLQRSKTPKNLITINKTLIASDQRVYEDVSPQQTNYYQVVAIGLNDQEFQSPVYYAQLIDSFPPSPPRDLKGTVNEQGLVKLSWAPNTESDIYGYRIYKGNYRNEEFSQITREPIAQTTYSDSVPLKTLNRQVHYQLMAIDRNQNYSGLSEVLTLELPDKVKPVSPVFLPVTSSRDGITLQWLPSSSDDVVQYDVYRKDGSQWMKISSVVHSTDSLFQFIDKESLEGTRFPFTVIAVDRSGLESEPASPISAAKIINPIKPPVTILEIEVDRNKKKVVLRWSYNQQGVDRYHVYRAKEGERLKLYSTILSPNTAFEDKYVTMNSNYTYRILASFGSGAKSELSEEIKVKY